MDYILTTENLTKIYGEKRAADSVSLHIKKGDVYGLIGRNGAGKTTLVKLLLHLYEPNLGKITLNGTPIERGYITHDEIAAGGELVIEMGDDQTKWY